MRGRRSVGLLLAVSNLLLAGCGAGWRRVPLGEGLVLPKRQQVQIWRRGQVVTLHAVTLAADSVYGVPYLRSPDCDSCRVALPRVEVDSARFGDPASGFWQTVVLMVALGFGGYLALCAKTNFCGWFD